MQDKNMYVSLPKTPGGIFKDFAKFLLSPKNTPLQANILFPLLIVSRKL